MWSKQNGFNLSSTLVRWPIKIVNNYQDGVILPLGDNSMLVIGCILISISS